MRRMTLALTLSLPLATAGCGDSILDQIAASQPTPVIVTDTFSGTLTRNGATSHPFPITSAGGGDVTLTLKTVSPDAATVVGISLGTWNGTSCQAVISNDRAIQGASMLGRATSTGELCARIFDPGTIGEPQAYEIQVVHP